MKRVFLLFTLLQLAPALMVPSLYAVKAQRMDLTTPAQKDAVEQWSKVIQRGQTSTVMFQVAHLLKKVADQVESERKRIRTEKGKAGNLQFVWSLRGMQRAANLKAKGLRNHSPELLQRSDRARVTALKFAYGKIAF